MRTTKTIGLALAAAALLAPAAGAAEYQGKTKSGTSISFRVNGDRLSRVSTTVPATCLETSGSYGTRAGVELYRPPGSFALGRTGKAKALQPAAMNRGIKATKTYTVTTKRGRRGAVTGTLRVSFSFLSLGYDVYHSYTWMCTGSTKFSLRPR